MSFFDLLQFDQTGGVDDLCKQKNCQNIGRFDGCCCC